MAGDPDVELLQCSVNILTEWCADNGLSLNVEKCCFVTYTTKKRWHLSQYSVRESPLSRRELVKDLGVWFDTKMTFFHHYDVICGGAIRALGFVIRTCREFEGEDLVVLLYNSFVRSKLEYCLLVWHPYYTSSRLMIEKVQRRFLKYLCYRSRGIYPPRGTDYNSLLLEHGFDSLQVRRELRGCTFLRKLLSGAVDCPWLLEQLCFSVPRISALSPFLFHLQELMLA